MSLLKLIGFEIYQRTKVRLHKFTEEGIEVYTDSKVDIMGFIPYRNLVTNTNNLHDNYSFYVHFLGFKEPYLLFAEEGTLVFPDIPPTAITIE